MQGATAWRDSALALSSSETRRGFTDHEQLDDFGLVHMNGRVHDPHLACFLSADLFVQFALSSQDYNRYTYTNNNPLSFADPSEHIWKFIKSVLQKASAFGITVAAVETVKPNPPQPRGFPLSPKCVEIDFP